MLARWLQWGMLALAAASAASQLLLLAHYAPRLWRADAPGTIAGQPFSISPFGYGEVRQQVLAAGAKCGFDRPETLHRLLIDDVSYFAYSSSRYPMHRLGVLTEWRGDIRDPLAWMRAQGSPGAVLACDELSPAMRAIAKPSGAFCCLRTP